MRIGRPSSRARDPGTVRVAGDPLAAPRGAAVRLWICSNCDYDLSGLAGSGVCPECGEAYEGGWIHVRGWRHWRSVPMGPRSKSRLLAHSMIAALLISFAAHGMIGRTPTGVGVVGLSLGLFVPLYVMGWMQERRALRAGPRPMHAFLGPTALDVTGVWRSERLGWGRFRHARIRRLARGAYRLTLTGPGLATFLRELVPWEIGLWRVVVVFHGTSRDAALVRRVARRGIARAAQEGTGRPRVGRA